MFKQRRDSAQPSAEREPRVLTDAEAYRSGVVAQLALRTTTAALESQLGPDVVDAERAAELKAATQPLQTQADAQVYQFPLRRHTEAELSSGAPVANMMTPLPGFGVEVTPMPGIGQPNQDQQAA
jgi:hypothetical protein